MSNQGSTGQQSWIKWLVIGVVVVLVGCGAWYAWGYFQTRGQIAAYKETVGDPPSTSAGPTSISPADEDTNGSVSKDELASLSNPEDAANVDPGDLVDAYGSDFDNWRQLTYDILNKKGWLNADQKAALAEMPSLGYPKAQWSDQAVLNAISLDIADATIQEPPELGVLMLPAVLSPDVPFFNKIRDAIGERTNVTIYRADLRADPRDNEFMGIDGLSPNARALAVDFVNADYGESGDAHSRYIVLVDLQQGTNNLSLNWRMLGRWDSQNSSARAAFSKIS